MCGSLSIHIGANRCGSVQTKQRAMETIDSLLEVVERSGNASNTVLNDLLKELRRTKVRYHSILANASNCWENSIDVCDDL